MLKDLVATPTPPLLMITHDLGVVAGLCDEVNVMYSGRIVEAARWRAVRPAAAPVHRGLLASIPRLDAAGAARR